MTLVNPETGELIEALNAEDAERLSNKISLRLDTIADNYVAVMPMIREAVTRQAHAALGYRSPGEYVSDRFGGALGKLGIEVRRAVVHELTEAGLSKRAIAPVVGVTHGQVSKDRTVIAGGSSGTTSQPDAPSSLPAPGSAGDDFTGRQQQEPVERSTPAANAREGEVPAAPRPPVTGIDGKTYARPAPINHAARADAAVADFPDLAYYRDEAIDLEHCWRLADTLRTFAEPELSSRIETLRRSIAADRAKRNGTYVSPLPQARTCPTCGQTVKD